MKEKFRPFALVADITDSFLDRIEGGMQVRADASRRKCLSDREDLLDRLLFVSHEMRYRSIGARTAFLKVARRKIT